MKKLINSPDTYVSDSIRGLTARSTEAVRVSGWNIVVARRVDPDTVSIVSGGGAGHEPAHAGYVGTAMLDAAVVGEVFSSPSVDAVLTAIRAVAGSAGVLLVVKNYTGDRLNFGLAAELARAEGIAVEIVVIADDVALPDTGRVGPRGLAGTVLVHKVAGALAQRGAALGEVAEAARAVGESVSTMSISLSACTVPAVGEQSFELGPGEAEWGLGIHGEAGLERTHLPTSRQIARRLIAHFVSVGRVRAGEEVAVLLNGLGGTPPSELDIVSADLVEALSEAGLVVRRFWSGDFMTSLDMQGCSISVLKLRPELLELLDTPTGAPGWPHMPSPDLAHHVAEVPAPAARTAPPVTAEGLTLARDSVLIRTTRAVARALLAAESTLTELDRIVGDGDLGMSLARGARSILEFEPGLLESPGVADFLRSLSAIVRRDVGGTSGPLYSLLLARAAAVLGEDTASEPAAAWANAFAAGVRAIEEAGGARLGDCTMVDALAPAARVLVDRLEQGVAWQSALDDAVSAANEGTEATSTMRASLGRSTYIGRRAVGHVDPGAQAATVWLSALRDELAGRNREGAPPS